MNNYKCIYAIGDLHGSFEKTLNCLRLAKLIDKDNNWIAKNVCLVQIGDQIDSRLKVYEKGSIDYNKDDDIKIMKYFFKLKRQAIKYNSQVILIAGNHELINTQGIFDYISKKAEENKKTRKELFKPGGKMALLMAKNTQVIAVINGIIFCHAGILPKHIKYIKDNHLSVQYINTMFQDYLRGPTINSKLKSRGIESYNKAHFEELLNNDTSILWNRGYACSNAREIAKATTYVNEVLSATGCHAMVIGHNPQVEGITNYANRRLWLIDAGMSYAVFSNPAQILKISSNNQSINKSNPSNKTNNTRTIQFEVLTKL